MDEIMGWYEEWLYNGQCCLNISDHGTHQEQAANCGAVIAAFSQLGRKDHFVRGLLAEHAVTAHIVSWQGYPENRPLIYLGNEPEL